MQPCRAPQQPVAWQTIRWILLTKPKINGYWRFIDDTFYIAQGTEQDILSLEDASQVLIPRIRLTYTHSRETVHFLDISISIREGRLVLDLFEKEFNRFLYISFKSFHHSSTMRAWVANEFRRIRRTCTESKDMAHRSRRFAHRLQARGYPAPWILKRQEEALIDKQTTSDGPVLKIPFVIRDSSRTRRLNIGNILHEGCPDFVRPILARKRPKTLLELLARKKHQKTSTRPPTHPTQRRKRQTRLMEFYQTKRIRVNRGCQ